MTYMVHAQTNRHFSEQFQAKSYGLKRFCLAAPWQLFTVNYIFSLRHVNSAELKDTLSKARSNSPSNMGVILKIHF